MLTPDESGVAINMDDESAALYIKGSEVQLILPRALLGKNIPPNCAAWDAALCAFFLSNHPLAVMARLMLAPEFEKLVEGPMTERLNQLSEESKNEPPAEKFH